jgi:hypothetical protein
LLLVLLSSPSSCLTAALTRQPHVPLSNSLSSPVLPYLTRFLPNTRLGLVRLWSPPCSNSLDPGNRRQGYSATKGRCPQLQTADGKRFSHQTDQRFTLHCRKTRLYYGIASYPRSAVYRYGPFAPCPLYYVCIHTPSPIISKRIGFPSTASQAIPSHPLVSRAQVISQANSETSPE